MRRVSLVLLVLLAPTSTADDGCASGLVVYSGGDGLVNTGGACGGAILLGNAFPTEALPDTRYLLPGDHVGIGLLDVESPAGIDALIHGLGHDGTRVALHDEGNGYWSSDPVPVSGQGELRVSVALPDGTRIETVYRTLPTA